MIDYKRKFIFLHIPKCAGTSIGNFFINEFQYKNDELSLYKDFNYFTYDSHRIHFDNLNEEILQNYFVFTIVRHPYTRFVSEYKYNEELNIDDFDYYCENFQQIWDKKYGKLKDFNWLHSHNIQRISDGVYNNIHRISQTDYLKGTYSDSIHKIRYIDKIIKFENLNEGIQEVFQYLNLQNKKLPHSNSSNIKKFEHKKINLSKRNKDIIFNLYRSDFINFGYSP
jgi:hypothetical protein